MSSAEYELVVSLVDGDALELSRTFRPGHAQPPLSVGARAEWAVSAAEVADLHFWLQFDGQRLFVAAGPTAPTYLQNLRVGKEWQELADGAELRFGRALIRVQARLSQVPATRAAQAPVRPVPLPAPPNPNEELQPQSFSRIDRAAAAPLPEFFRERLREKGRPPQAAPEQRVPHERHELPPRPPFARDEHQRPRSSTPPPDADRFRKRQRLSAVELPARTERRSIGIVLGVSVPLLLGVLVLMWLLVGSDRHPPRAASLGSVSAGVTPSALVAERAAPEPRPNLALPAIESPVAREAALAPPPLTDMPALREPPAAQPPRAAYPQNIADRPVPRVGAEPWEISDAWRAHHEQLLHAPNREHARVVFLGDSITEGWATAPAYKASFSQYAPLNLGVAGDFTQNVLWRIDHGELAGIGPSVLVLMVGVNNLAGGFSAQQTVAGIRAIVSDVRSRLPSTKILLLGILPAREKPDDPVRLRIVEANRALAASTVMPFVSFHDVGAVLLEPDGTLSKAIARDFIHPTAAGYERLTGAIAPLLVALLAQP